ncbi:MAG: hypothetical protein U0V48_03580 [Anaerolineales bacterium]
MINGIRSLNESPRAAIKCTECPSFVISRAWWVTLSTPPTME